MRLTLCKAPSREPRPDHYTGNSVPYSLRQVRGFFNYPADHILKIQETGPMIYRTYPRRILSCVNWGIRSSESSPVLFGGSLGDCLEEFYDSLQTGRRLL